MKAIKDWYISIFKKHVDSIPVKIVFFLIHILTYEI